MENHVQLRWASHQGTVLSVFDAFLTSETMVDVTLAADGQYIRAHKILLSACSPYFQELLSLDPNKNPIIFMKDVKYSELKALVQFIYRGEVNIAQDDLPSFHAVAQSLKIRGLASLDTPANNIGSDTLILPDFNLPSTSSSSKPTGPGPSSAGINTMASTYERHEPPPVLIKGYHQPAPYTPTSSHGNQAQTQTQSSISNISDLRSSGPIVSPILPPPTKRLRGQQLPRDRDPLEFNPVIVSMSGATVQSHTMPSSQIYDPLSTQTQGTSHMAASDPDQQGHLKNNQMDDQQQTEQIFQPGEVKAEEIHAMGGVYDEAEEEEEEDNSMSQSSFSESWKHGETHDFEDNSMLEQEQDDDGEMPGTSGTGNEAGPSGQAAGRQGEDNQFECESCGRRWEPRDSSNRVQYRRYVSFGCPSIPRKFQCRHCGRTFRRQDFFRVDEAKCSRGRKN